MAQAWPNVSDFHLAGSMFSTANLPTPPPAHHTLTHGLTTVDTMLPRIREHVRRLIAAPGATSSTSATEAADTDPGPGGGTDSEERPHATALAALQGTLRSEGSGGAKMTFDADECTTGQPANYPPAPSFMSRTMPDRF
jgi:hypothetical protein